MKAGREKSSARGAERDLLCSFRGLITWETQWGNLILLFLSCNEVVVGSDGIAKKYKIHKFSSYNKLAKIQTFQTL